MLSVPDSQLHSSGFLNSGVPQGSVLSPLLYSLFAHDGVPVYGANTIMKFSDDSTVADQRRRWVPQGWGRAHGRGVPPTTWNWTPRRPGDRRRPQAGPEHQWSCGGARSSSASAMISPGLTSAFVSPGAIRKLTCVPGSLWTSLYWEHNELYLSVVRTCYFTIHILHRLNMV